MITLYQYFFLKVKNRYCLLARTVIYVVVRPKLMDSIISKKKKENPR